MNPTDLEKHLKQAADHLAPNDSGEQLWSVPVPKARGEEWYLDGLNLRPRRKGKTAARILAAAACFLLCVISAAAFLSFRVESVVYLDVNPSITLETNRRDKVLRAAAGNADGEKVLAGMDLRRTDLDVAVNAILGSMVRSGYLNEQKNTVLLSINGRNEEKADALRHRLSIEISSSLDRLTGNGHVYNQSVPEDEEVSRLAEEHQISPGKAALLQKLTEANPQFDYEILADLSMDDLEDLLDEDDVDLEDYADLLENDDEEDDDDDNDDDDDSDEEDEENDEKEDEEDDEEEEDDDGRS